MRQKSQSLSAPRRERLRANLRPPPSYMEYGADLLNLEKVQLMSLAERGLFATLRWRIWANDSLPRDPAQLARLLGLEAQDVHVNLTDAVLSFFASAPDDQTRIVCPELATQKQQMMDRREKQAIGGSEGGKTAREKRKAGVGNPLANPPGETVVTLVSAEMKRKEVHRSASTGRVDITTDQEVRSMRRAFGESI